MFFVVASHYCMAAMAQPFARMMVGFMPPFLVNLPQQHSTISLVKSLCFLEPTIEIAMTGKPPRFQKYNEILSKILWNLFNPFPLIL